jgi:glycosyltransferase involved in cell wall biosynthesis
MEKNVISPIRIGMICPYWLPKHGGGEQYNHHLALELLRQGFDVRVFTGTLAQEGKDNGRLDVQRPTLTRNLAHSSWSAVHKEPTGRALSLLMNHYLLMEQAVQWCIEHNIQIALISNPWQQTDLVHVRELYVQLKRLGIKIGQIHFDLAPQVERGLSQTYQRTQSWDITRDIQQRSLEKILRENSRLQAFYMMGSPLFFEPDFVLSCSEWSAAFIDPEGRTPRLVLHPILDRDHWSAIPSQDTALDASDVLMINPSKRKGPQLMADLINTAPSDMRFRVLNGGWGNALKTFEQTISQSAAYQSWRVELREYVLDIRQAYLSTGLVFFPSLYEGYGMTAVEPMYAGIPVVSSNHPAIIEAVGSGALTLCPYHDSPQRWASAVEEVLSQREVWAQKARARSQDLDARQAIEIQRLCGFLVEQLR